MHSPEHAGNKAVDAVAFVDERYQRGDFAFIICAVAEMREDQLLKGVDLVLELHEVRDCFVAVCKSAGSVGSLNSGFRRQSKQGVA